MPRRQALEEVSLGTLNTISSSPGETPRRATLTPRTRRVASDGTPSRKPADNVSGTEDVSAKAPYSDPLSPPQIIQEDPELLSRESTPDLTNSAVDHFKPIFQMGSRGSTIQLTLNCPPGHHGPFIVNLDVGSLLGVASAQTPFHITNTPYLQFATNNECQGPSTSKGFASFPPEIRNRIYRLLLVKNGLIEFQAGRNNSCTSSLLRTSRQMYQEGRSILYGENKFMFSRVSDRTGPWFAPYREEVGYKDMERFFRAIGSYNISLLKDITLHLSDALPIITQDLEPEERRFVNEESLQRVLKMLGKHGKLESIQLTLAGKRMVTKADKDFLDALTSFMAKNVKIAGKVDAKIKKEVLLFMRSPGPYEPMIRSWCKPWEPAFGGKCR